MRFSFYTLIDMIEATGKNQLTKHRLMINHIQSTCSGSERNQDLCELAEAENEQFCTPVCSKTDTKDYCMELCTWGDIYANA